MLVEDWGLIDYQASQTRQLELVEEIANGAPSRLVFCSHPPVVTLGRGSTPEDLVGWSGSVVESNRGGKATFHGPNQLVIYPLIDISSTRDIAKYLRNLENVMIDALDDLGLEGTSRASENGDKSFTGVWVGQKKVASIGIAVKKWITHHGCAINLRPDPLAFTGINPCGFTTKTMTDLETELGKPVDEDYIKFLIAEKFEDTFFDSDSDDSEEE